MKITRPFVRAKYTLLYAQALDEMRIPVQSDSMIRGALQYYAHSRDYDRMIRRALKKETAKQRRQGVGSPSLQDSLVLDKAKAFFYYGRILENRKNVKDAIAAYLDAAGVLEQGEVERRRTGRSVRMDAEEYLKGRIYGVLARMLHEQHSLKDALKYYQVAEQAYAHLGDTVRLMQVAEGKALVQYLMNQYPGALGDYNQALRYAEALGDTTRIISLSRGMAALIFHFTGDVRLTKEVLIQTSEKYHYTLDYKDYPLLASVYLRERRVARARFFFEKSLEREKSYTSSQKIGMYSIGAKIEAGAGHYERAYSHSARMAEIADSLSKSERENLVIGLIQEYNHKKLDLEKETQAQRHRYLSVIYVLVIVISALLMVGAVLIVIAHRSKIRRKNGEIMAYLQQLHAMKESRTGFSPQEMCAVLSDTPQNIYVKKYRLKNKLAEFIKNNPEADF